MKKRLIFLLMVTLLVTAIMPSVDAKGEEMAVTAPAAVLMEASSGKVLYEKNPHEERPCASITKVMTLCLVFEAIDDGRLTLDQPLTASAHAESMGGSDIWLKAGEVMTVDDLIKATVIMSANDAAVVLAEAVSGSEEVFVTAMNAKANEWGMMDTVFKNCNGLDEDGHVTSAYDVAIMSRELIKHEKIFDYTLTWMDSVRNGETQLVNTNKLIKTYNGITGLKTGTTSKAGSCITATAERNSLSLISVVLGADSTDARFSDAAMLLDYGFANWVVTIPENPELSEVAIKGGMQKTVKATAQEPPKILLESTKSGEVTPQVVMREDLEAPIEKGDLLGKIKYMSGETELAEVAIVADSDVEAITLGNTFWYLLQGLACG